MRDKMNKLTSGSNLIWESSRMILPEHKEAILQHRRELERKEKPELDEQRIEELRQTIAQALQTRSRVRMVVYDPFEPQELSGTVVQLDPVGSRIRLQDDGRSVWVDWADVMDVTGVAAED